MKVVIIERDWSDEFSTYGFATFTEEEYTKFLENIDNSEYPRSYGFGTNEEHEFFDAEDYKRDMKVIEITEKEHEVLKKIFDPYATMKNKTFSVGIFPMIE